MLKIATSSFNRFIKLESAGGILLMISAVFAIIIANTNLSSLYSIFLATPIEIRFALEFNKL